jgi:hypothetical protein
MRSQQQQQTQTGDSGDKTEVMEHRHRLEAKGKKKWREERKKDKLVGVHTASKRFLSASTTLWPKHKLHSTILYKCHAQSLLNVISGSHGGEYEDDCLM